MPLSEIFDLHQTAHLRAGFYSLQNTLAWHDDSLPYLQLGDKEFERLCYLLSLAEGKVPRYFGNPGQKQYGIDLLVTQREETTVYQCKNVKEFPLGKMKAALQLFEKEWLGKPSLPKPTAFVLCCPLPLQELRQNENWTILENDFKQRTGVSVTLWDHNYLNERLKNLPDVVADIFSNQTAERFCNLTDWNADLFRPLSPHSGEPNLNRYLAQKDAKRIYLDPKLVEEFTMKSEITNSLLIRGLPGTGKTVTGIALAEALRHRYGHYRIYYINLLHDLTENQLVDGIKRRLTQPTLFFLDDCQGKYEYLNAVHDRLQSVLSDRSGKCLLVFAARTIPTTAGMPRGDASTFEDRMALNGALLEFKTTASLFYQIIITHKPGFKGLSKDRLNTIFEFTGHDLFLLDQVLETLENPAEIDRMKPESLFEKTLKRYFGAPTVHRPVFMEMAALAQFDLRPRVATFDFDLKIEDTKAEAQLLVIADRPPRYYFLHSSAAELIFRALTWNDSIDDHTGKAAEYLIVYFQDQLVNDSQFSEDFSKVIHNQLVLRSDKETENLLKTRFLADNTIYALVTKHFEHLALNSIAVCLKILETTNKTTFIQYHGLVQGKIEDGVVLRMLLESPFWENWFFLLLLKRHYSDLCSRLRQKLVHYGINNLVNSTDIQNIFGILSNLFSPHDAWLTSALDTILQKDIDKLLQRTISAGRSIGTLSFTLRELRKTYPHLLKKLGDKFGLVRWRKLLCVSGTIQVLGNIMQYLDKDAVKELAVAFERLTLEDWKQLLLRGDFKNLCNFVRWRAHVFSKLFTTELLNSLRPTFEALIRQADWQSLGQCTALLKESPESPIRRYLEWLSHDYAISIQTNLSSFDSFDEAIGCIDFLWKQIPACREQLIPSLLSLLPETKTWYTCEHFLRKMRALFFIFSDPHTPLEHARQVLSLGNTPKVANLFRTASLLDIWLYLWNLYSLWFTMSCDQKTTFFDFLQPELQNALLEVINNRPPSLLNPEKTDNWIILLGGVDFFGLPHHLINRTTWTPSLPSLQILLKRILDKRFVPSAFFLFGLEQLFDCTIDPNTWKYVLKKAESYDEKTTALENLCKMIRIHLRNPRI